MAFLIKKKSQRITEIVLTPQKLKILCRESNQINGEKIVLCSTAEKKIVCF